MSMITFPDETTSDSIRAAIGETPDGVLVGPPATHGWLPDGRCAIAHPFSLADEAWLRDYVATYTGVEVLTDQPIGGAVYGTAIYGSRYA